MVNNLGLIVPAGPRLRRLDPLPVDDFTYFDQGEAEEAAGKLQAYADANITTKTRKKKGKRK